MRNSLLFSIPGKAYQPTQITSCTFTKLTRVRLQFIRLLILSPSQRIGQLSRWRDRKAVTSLRIIQQELTNLRIVEIQQRLALFVQRVNMARQKKPSQTYNDSNVLTIAGTDSSVVEEYLKNLSFTGVKKVNKHRKVYDFVRDLMLDSLMDKQKRDPLYAALIERIARMTVIVDKIERQLFNDLPNLDEKDITARLGGNYLAYLREYRNFITSFSDLRWAGDQIQKTKQVEKVREITREEVIEN